MGVGPRSAGRRRRSPLRFVHPNGFHVSQVSETNFGHDIARTRVLHHTTSQHKIIISRAHCSSLLLFRPTPSEAHSRTCRCKSVTNYNRRPGDSFGDSAPLLLSLEAARVRGVRGACGTRALQVPSRTGAPVELPRAGSSAPPNLPSTQCAALFRWRRLRWRERADLVGLVRASQWGGAQARAGALGVLGSIASPTPQLLAYLLTTVQSPRPIGGCAGPAEKVRAAYGPPRTVCTLAAWPWRGLRGLGVAILIGVLVAADARARDGAQVRAQALLLGQQRPGERCARVAHTQQPLRPQAVHPAAAAVAVEWVRVSCGAAREERDDAVHGRAAAGAAAELRGQYVRVVGRVQVLRRVAEDEALRAEAVDT